MLRSHVIQGICYTTALMTHEKRMSCKATQNFDALPMQARLAADFKGCLRILGRPNATQQNLFCMGPEEENTESVKSGLARSGQFLT